MARDKHYNKRDHLHEPSEKKGFFSRFFEPVPDDTDGILQNLPDDEPIEEWEDDPEDDQVTQTDASFFDGGPLPYQEEGPASPFSPPDSPSASTARRPPFPPQCPPVFDTPSGRQPGPGPDAFLALPETTILSDTGPIRHVASPVSEETPRQAVSFTPSPRNQSAPYRPTGPAFVPARAVENAAAPASSGYVPLVSQVDLAKRQSASTGAGVQSQAELIPPASPVPPVYSPIMGGGPDGQPLPQIPLESPVSKEPPAPVSSYAASFLSGAAANAGIDDFTQEEQAQAQAIQAPVRLFDNSGRHSAADLNVGAGQVENIRLFDDEDDLSDSGRHRMGDTTRTRMFRTGTGTTTRIHLNETEESLRMEEAQQRATAREAKIRREERRERENKRKQRQRTIKKLFGNIAFVLFFLAALIVALYYGFLLSEVSVLGNDKYEAKYIVDLSGLKTGTHMLFCDLDQAKENIQQDPYLQVDQISYIFPNRVRIVVTERKEVAGIIGLDYNVIIDDQGYVLSMSGGTDLTGLLQVTGVSMTGFQLGQRLGEGNDFTTATLVDIIDKLEEYNLLGSITAVDLTTPLAITLTAKNGLSIHLGQGTDLDAKMVLLYKLLPNFITKHNITTGTLYLSAKGGAVYSPTNAEENAMKAAENAAALTPEGTETLDNPAFVDEDGDGLDDSTGLPQATPAPTPIPTPNVPGGTSDAFSG